MNEPRDPHDAAFAEGVQNWNLVLIKGRIERDPMFTAILQRPEAQRACFAYAGTRYLGLLSVDDVFERYRILFVATMELDEEGFLSPGGWSVWHEKRVHAATELAIRNMPLDDPRALPEFGFVRTPRVLQAVAAAKRRTLEWGSHPFVKYGDVRFLRAALKEGIIRISPASSYDDPSLNVARRDAELERSLTDSAFEMTATLGGVGDRLSAEERAMYMTSVRSAVDYYMFCVAAGYQLRLFDDFDANACLVITDSIRFLTDLKKAVARELPGWHYGNELVEYIDPVQTLSGRDGVDLETFSPFFCKHYRYHYQREIRVAWLPPNPVPQEKPLDHVFVTLGSLEDYCELVELAN